MARAVLVALLVWLMAPVGEANEVFKGVGPVRVQVLGSELPGLTLSTLQTDVELRLRQFGVPIEPQAVSRLVVIVLAYHQQDAEHFAYSLHVRFREYVLVRGVLREAATWESRRAIGIGRAGQLGPVRDTVRDLVDEFINAYLAANPKR